MVFPADFLPVAEETGVIITVDRLVLHEACREFRAWQKQYPPETPLRLSVNFSAHQFRQVDLVDVTDRILSETGFDPATWRSKSPKAPIWKIPTHSPR